MKQLFVYSVKIKISETEYVHAKIIWPPKSKDDEDPNTEVLQLWMFKNGETLESPLDFMYPIVAIDPEDEDMMVTFKTTKKPVLPAAIKSSMDGQYKKPVLPAEIKSSMGLVMWGHGP